MICAVYFSLVQVPKAVKVLLSHQAGPEPIRLSDQWGRNCLHHAAAAVRLIYPNRAVGTFYAYRKFCG